ncbi:uncharacterized protein LOC121263644 isoform X2 [Juglans microcarpa x Juglans regia]|uniref:uncharacterized protein LOC121263644 isoform X1 n=1 Tax=Juglans microcarpa x Juglans regia TaxID=2249226 RepID=UPI001B7E3D37|nr:uncharacterized protein LOC121263644 isoform X1 [Juglans microcarpa x Juglans regia]XP_041022602.1 uncharacterized protein LOC121263644 isoform X2 [Juglans microcarpa x Juglans regia]
MEENQNGPKSVGIRQKILSAFTHVFPVFRKVRRSTSSREQVPKPASSPSPNPKNNEIQTKPPAPEHPKSLQGFQHLEHIEVPVEFDHSSLHSPDVRAKPATVPHFPIQGDKAASGDEEKQKPKLEAPEKTLADEVNPGLDINDRSFYYIKHAKMKIIRTGSKVGGRKKATSGLQDDDAQDTKKRDQGAKDDLFSEYINGAKTRIRTTPSMKSGRIVSFNRK